MTTRSTFKLSDAKRLAKAAVAAGMSPDGIEIEAKPDGSIIVRPVVATGARSADNEWDEVLDE